MAANTNNNQNHDSSSARGRLLRRGAGFGAAAVLATAGVASAATDHPAGAHQSTGGAAITAHASAAAKPYSSVNASPRTLTPGQRVTITGNAPKNTHAGEWITLQSMAFASHVKLNGIPVVRTQVLVNGTYKVTATIQPGIRSTNYAIMGTHNGKPLDTVAWINVRPYSSVAATPRVASAGQQVTITGNGPRNAHAGQWITLKSAAFASRATTDGVPSIRTQVLVNGTYKVTAAIRPGMKAGTYAVKGTFIGQPLDTVAHITVR